MSLHHNLTAKKGMNQYFQFNAFQLQANDDRHNFAWGSEKKFGLSIAGLRQRFKAPASDFLYLYNQAVGKNHEMKNNKKI